MTARRYRLHARAADQETELLRTALATRGWEPTAGGDWDLWWSSAIPNAATYRKLSPVRRANRFPGTNTLDFKDELFLFLHRATQRVGAGDGLYDFFPRTFSMPHQLDRWRAAVAAEPDTLWIVKPKRGANGQGVRVVVEPESVELDADSICQEYIADPLLLPGEPCKHVVRLYVLITSLDPLVAYLYPNGPVKFASRPFGTAAEDLTEPVIHLTNPAVQRTNTDVTDPVRAVDIPKYRQRLRAAGYNDSLLWDRIRSVLTQTLIAHREPMLRVSSYLCPNLSSCFELVGFDVLVDSQLRPWVIECNCSPALALRGREGSTHEAAQHAVKVPMVNDMLDLIGAGDHGFDPRPVVDRLPEEVARRGAFEVLYPAEAARYRDCFTDLRPGDSAVIDGVQGSPRSVTARS